MSCHITPKKCLKSFSVCTTAPKTEKESILFYQSEDIMSCLFFHFVFCLFDVVTMVLMVTNRPPFFSAWTLPFCPFVSTVLCSSANEFICTSPFLSQHINPDHWSHPYGKTVSLQAWSAASDWPFHPGPPLDPLLWVSVHLHFNTAPAHTQPPPAPRWHIIVNSPWGSPNCPPGCPHAIVAFTTFRNEAVETLGRFLCWEWNWESLTCSLLWLISHYYCSSSQTPCWDALWQYRANEDLFTMGINMHF